MTHREALELIDHPALRAPTNSAAFSGRPTHWADLGCGSGTFTLALADLLAPGSTIEAIDLRPGVAAQTTSRGVIIRPRTADFTTLNFAAPAQTSATPNSTSPNSTPSETSATPNTTSPETRATPNTTPPNSTPSEPPNSTLPEILPDRAWPGLKPLMYHGILMANSLHYVADQAAFLTRLKTNALLLIEYDLDLPVPTWVPNPLSFARAIPLLKRTGWPKVQKLGTHPSGYFVGAASPRSSSSVPFASLRNGRADLYAALALPAE